MKFTRVIRRDRRSRLTRFQRRTTARIVPFQLLRREHVAAMFAAQADNLTDAKRAVRLWRGLPCRRPSSACGGHDSRQGREGSAPLLGRCGTFGHSLMMLHGGKAKLARRDRRRSPSARRPCAPAAPPRVSLLHGRLRLRHQSELMDEPATRAPAVKLAAQRGARVPLCGGGCGSLRAVIAGREPSTGWPSAPARLRRVLVAVGLAVVRPREFRRQDRGRMIRRRSGSPFQPWTFPAPLSSAARSQPADRV